MKMLTIHDYQHRNRYDFCWGVEGEPAIVTPVACDNTMCGCDRATTASASSIRVTPDGDCWRLPMRGPNTPINTETRTSAAVAAMAGPLVSRAVRRMVGSGVRSGCAVESAWGSAWGSARGSASGSGCAMLDSSLVTIASYGSSRGLLRGGL